MAGVKKKKASKLLVKARKQLSTRTVKGKNKTAKVPRVSKKNAKHSRNPPKD